jgi:hypothetical protein
MANASEEVHDALGLGLYVRDSGIEDDFGKGKVSSRLSKPQGKKGSIAHGRFQAMNSRAVAGCDQRHIAEFLFVREIRPLESDRVVRRGPKQCVDYNAKGIAGVRRTDREGLVGV